MKPKTHHIVPFALAAGLCGTSPSLSLATTFAIDSTTGKINNLASGDINGVQFAFAGNVGGGTIAQFRVYGDLELLPGDLVTGSGNRGISILVAGDVSVAAGVEFRCSALVNGPGPGGGAGGPGQLEVGEPGESALIFG
ncbi:MAG: hypothetical protein L0Y42_16475, partial [Phycisphaerales bacterium]|nr:hypothetical protein [Phycisphaerales bacterium]